MLKRVLIANRGEIALRIQRACAALGIETVAAYSRVDESLLHLRYADDAVCVGSTSYLDVNNMVMAALSRGCDAVHPGYGFLSENAAFAAAVEDAGLAFIGPKAEHIELMGDKVNARAVAAELGLAVTPGSSLVEDADAGAQAEALGFPVMLKAAAGGGGRGMRIVETNADLAGALARAREEARTFFGSDGIYLERFYPAPRHVEVQVLGDGAGAGIHYLTRDCSVQRRHQKLIEEAPAPAIEGDKLTGLGEQCAEAVARLGYRGAGTFEFLYADDTFYFMEMNTRLQVEHPVTEMVTGVDLVAAQLRIAGGDTVLPAGEERGHAIECRINAEDDAFRPSPGRVTELILPGGAGIRVDTHLYPGYVVPHHYDSLVAKVIAHGGDRAEALARMLRALRELRIGGIETNRKRHIEMLSDPAFQAGGVDTGFLRN
ncbi:MAG: acetyl-CoA carboxylase biotin carboxylase subunit [Gammaproteobacteria bacterium]|nr:acetyl-CoA carboxylase biotin carboxylase subunit [Gammaproteobacteria bacterium]MBS05051.1 acetyl-CoA carboxylase biotin carboxylase subunit [Gammaproteobacteria bacterium]|tara:strand:- start:945 stop:2240 length:1296 start_codon:yes stop_codon:yes gene_type:complete